MLGPKNLKDQVATKIINYLSKIKTKYFEILKANRNRQVNYTISADSIGEIYHIHFYMERVSMLHEENTTKIYIDNVEQCCIVTPMCDGWTAVQGVMIVNFDKNKTCDLKIFKSGQKTHRRFRCIMTKIN